MLILFTVGKDTQMAMDMPRVKAVSRQNAPGIPRVSDQGWARVAVDGKPAVFCDLARFFNLADPDNTGAGQAWIQVSVEGRPIFLAAGRIGSVVSPRPDQVEPTPPAVGKGAEFFPRVLKKDGRIIPVLDPDRMGRAAPALSETAFLETVLWEKNAPKTVDQNSALNPDSPMDPVGRALEAPEVSRRIREAVFQRLEQSRALVAASMSFSETDVAKRVPFALARLFDRGKWADRLNRETAVAFGRALMRQLKRQRSDCR